MLTRQSKRLVELVDDLLDLSRLEADSISIDPVELNVRERVVEIVGDVAENGITSTSRTGCARRRSERLRPHRLQPAR